ncbi:hypothetical protein Cgig2_016025 [Carnegiea gigantea]|uniref:Homeobox-leucine zipper protein n=1 Tax=Carnegiea gigantea TaxID=171969 RepID=A0A9Q1KMH7_9CARY|nr:hypothetical protein Cgig2_016025 [Carnegiea gigantea]
MMQGGELSQEATEADEEHFSPEEEPATPRKKKSKNNKRRFSDEQVKSLETIFESETKLEPRKKVQVARELGLQPRQVAIWFQNKRARWKSKQIEKNYRILKANYDNLKARFDSIKKEKDSLLEQKSHEGSSGCKDVVGNSQSFSIENGDIVADHHAILHSDDDKSGNMAYLGKDDPELLNISENIDSSIASSVKWCNFDAGGNTKKIQPGKHQFGAASGT